MKKIYIIFTFVGILMQQQVFSTPQESPKNAYNNQILREETLRIIDAVKGNEYEYIQIKRILATIKPTDEKFKYISDIKAVLNEKQEKDFIVYLLNNPNTILMPPKKIM